MTIDEHAKGLVNALADLLVAEFKRRIATEQVATNPLTHCVKCGRFIEMNHTCLLPEFLTVAEVQKLLGIGRSAAYQFAKAHGVRFGRSVRISRAEIETWKQNQPK